MTHGQFNSHGRRTTVYITCNISLVSILPDAMITIVLFISFLMTGTDDLCLWTIPSSVRFS